MNNHENARKLREQYGITELNSFEKAIMEYASYPKLENKELEKYFFMDMRPEYCLIMEDIWKCTSIEDHLNFLKDLDEYNSIIKVDHAIQIICKNTCEDEVDEAGNLEKLENIKEQIENLILNADIPSALKWEFYLMTRNPKEYVKEAIEVIKKYIPFYNELSSLRNEVIKDYNQELKNRLVTEGYEYLLKEIDYTYKFDKYDEINISTSALGSLLIYIENNTYYVLIGPSIKKALLNRNNKDTVEKNMSFIRNISENTRFKILQLLLERDYYGQEIADALNLTKATTFYHLNFLISLKVVTLVKDSQKNYYSINRDEILKGIDLFKTIWK